MFFKKVLRSIFIPPWQYPFLFPVVAINTLQKPYTFVNLLGSPISPTVEGELMRGFEGLDVGDRVHVELIGTDVER